MDVAQVSSLPYRERRFEDLFIATYARSEDLSAMSGW
jgi:hypothetical protein